MSVLVGVGIGIAAFWFVEYVLKRLARRMLGDTKRSARLQRELFGKADYDTLVAVQEALDSEFGKRRPPAYEAQSEPRS